ncbi:U3 snoRNP protein, partial [Kickxella alabastrina]
MAPALVVSEDAEMAGNEQEEDEQEEAAVSKAMSADERHAERIHEGLVWFLLPELKKKISDTNEDNMALRAPLAMAVVRILTALPAQTMAAQLPGVLTTICNMLRAKAQSARNATRDTLIRIAKFLGPSYLGFIIKELDASLARGPQRHILSYTVYTLLKEMSRGIRVGELDYALPQIVEIMVEDVFGQVSEEKDAVEWTTKSKEARVHHGPDCFEILAALCSFDHIRLMLTPLRDILRETDTPKRTKAVDMVLRRISIGLNRNRMYSTSGILTFCHGIINQYLALSSKTAQETNQMKAMKETLAQRLKPSGDALVTVHMKRSDLS